MSTAPQNDLTGTVLAGRYELHRLLGRGGMGAVYLATHRGLGRRVAVKVLLPDLASDGGVLARFEREARLSASLGHPNIVQVTDFGHAPGEAAFLVMEVLEGQTLRERLKTQGPLEPAECVRIAVQALAALDAAHRAGVLHRDLKPDNIFLLELQGLGTVVKLIDFGIARLTEGEGYAKLTATGVLVGTPQYMAPEQLTGGPLDGRTDLYALAVTLIRALTGKAPFAGGVADLLRVKVQGPAPSVRALRPDVPFALAALLEQCLAVEPSGRPASAHAMREALLAMSLEARASVPAQRPSFAASIVPPAPAYPVPLVAPALGTHAFAQPPRAPATQPAKSKLSPALVGGLAGFAMVVGVGALLLSITQPWSSEDDSEHAASAAPAPSAPGSSGALGLALAGAMMAGSAPGQSAGTNVATVTVPSAQPLSNTAAPLWSGTLSHTGVDGDVDMGEAQDAARRVVAAAAQCLETAQTASLDNSPQLLFTYRGSMPPLTLLTPTYAAPFDSQPCRAALLAAAGTTFYRPAHGAQSEAQLTVTANYARR